MSHIFKILILFTIINLCFAEKCVLNSESWCVFTSVKTTEDNLYFKPTANNPNYVKKVKFENSTLHTLTNEICNAFPNLQELEVDDTYLKKIAEGALHNCSKLIDVSFWTNELNDIPTDIFESNRLIESVTFQHNNLTQVDPLIFNNLTRLKTIAINENYLKEFPVYKMPRIPTLVTIWIHHNDLTDLDEQEIIFKFPNLKTIYMEDNPFNCNRLKVILAAFQRKQIAIERWHDSPRDRKYTLTQVDSVDCLSDEEREKYLSKARNDVLKEQLDEIAEEIGRVENIGKELNESFTALAETSEKIRANITIAEKIIQTKNISLAFDIIDKVKLEISKQQESLKQLDNYTKHIISNFDTLKFEVNNIKESQSNASHIIVIVISFVILIAISVVLGLWLYRRNAGLTGFKFRKAQEEVEFTSSTANIFVN